MEFNNIEQIRAAIKEIDADYRKAKDGILDSLKRQRLFEIKGNNKVFWDRDTGLLWMDYKSTPTKSFSVSEGEKMIEELDLGFYGFRLPKISEFKQLYRSGYFSALKPNVSFLMERGGRTLNSFETGFIIEKRTGTLMPCSDILFHFSGIDMKEYIALFRHNTKAGCDIALSLIEKSRLLIRLPDKSCMKALEDYLVRKPELKSDMPKMKERTSSPVLKVIPLPDHTSLTENYDIAAINASLYEYAKNGEKWCLSVISLLSKIEDQNPEIMKQLQDVPEICRKEFQTSKYISPAADDLFKKSHEILCSYLSTGFEKNKPALKKHAACFRTLKKRLESAAACENSIEELGKIEAEPRASFTLFTQMTLRSVNESIMKVNNFIAKKDVISWFASEYIRRYNYCEKFYSEGRAEFIEKCVKSKIKSTVAEVWSAELERSITDQLKVFCEAAEYYIGGSFKTNEKLSYQELFGILSEYEKTICEFYNVQRKEIHIFHAVRNTGSDNSLIEKLDADKKLYITMNSFRQKLFELIGKCSEKEALFIAKATENLCELSLMNIVDMEKSAGAELVCREIFDKLSNLRTQFYERMEQDARAFAAEQEKRESAVNELLFQMQSDLEKVT